MSESPQSWLSPKTVKELGLPTFLVILLVYVVYALATGGFQDLSRDVQTVKTQAEAIQDQHTEIKSQFQTLSQQLVNEARKQTKLQERICINGSRSTKDASNCVSDD